MRVYCLLYIASFLVPAWVSGQAERNLLAGRYGKALLQNSLAMRGIDSAYPAYANRQRWQTIKPEYAQQLISAGESALDYKWQTVPATTYLEYVRTGNRYIMEDIYNQNLTALKKLVFAELVEGKERFLPQIINGVWAVCEITSWSISASIGLQKKGPGLPDVNEPIVELGAGITADVMAWTYYLFKDSFNKYSPLIAQRLKQEIRRRILQPYYTRNDFWWMALDGKNKMVNNWNVWLNYSVLTCILLVEDDPAQRVEGIYKTMRSVDQFINYYKEDGGCEEGPAYWSHAGGMLFNYLSLLDQATAGSINLFDQPLIKNIGNYIGKAYIDSTWYLNYADAAAKLTTDAGIVYQFGKATGDTLLTKFGAYLAHQQQWEKLPPVATLYGGLRNLFSASELLQAPAEQPFLADAWMEGTGIALARDQAGSAQGFYFSALAGHNDESHNHNDVGTCVLFYNGKPVLIDVGSGIYTAKTFGPERYNIWTMRSAYHNVPLINGVEQKEGRQFAARNVRFLSTPTAVTFSTDIAAAYPASAQVAQWTRSYQLIRKRSFTIKDSYKLLANSGNTRLHFMTSAPVQQKKEGVLQLTAGGVNLDLQYNARAFKVDIEPVSITDPKLLQSWPPVIYRIVFTLLDRKATGNHQIIIKEAS
jgi:hypothetical protein